MHPTMQDEVQDGVMAIVIPLWSVSDSCRTKNSSTCGVPQQVHQYFNGFRSATGGRPCLPIVQIAPVVSLRHVDMARHVLLERFQRLRPKRGCLALDQSPLPAIG